MSKIKKIRIQSLQPAKKFTATNNSLIGCKYFGEDFLKLCWFLIKQPCSQKLLSNKDHINMTKSPNIFDVTLKVQIFKVHSFVAFPECMNFNFWTIYDNIGHSFKKRCHKPNHQLRLTVDYAVFHPGRSLLEILKLRQIFLNFFEVTHDYIISLFVKMHGEFLFDFLIWRK